MHSCASPPPRIAYQACTAALPTSTRISAVAPLTMLPSDNGELDPRTSGGVSGSRGSVAVATAIPSSTSSTSSNVRGPAPGVPERGSPIAAYRRLGRRLELVGHLDAREVLLEDRLVRPVRDDRRQRGVDGSEDVRPVLRHRDAIVLVR